MLLARAFQRDGHEVVVLSRSAGSRDGIRMVQWDAKSSGRWSGEIDGAHVIINLAGRSVHCRYNTQNRREMLESRVDSTRVIKASKNPPKLWLQSSTATIYAHRFDAPNDEYTGMIGGNEQDAPDTWKFSIEVAKAWEKALDDADTPRTRKVKLRSSMVMSSHKDGIFDVMLGLVKKGLGGTADSGKQYVSWIHDADFIRAIYWLIEHPIHGAVNICAPNPLPNKEFFQILRKEWRMPVGLPAAKWMLEIGALLMKTETELVLKSRRVIPTRLLENDFTFLYPDWPSAVKDLVHRIKMKQRDAVPDLTRKEQF